MIFMNSLQVGVFAGVVDADEESLHTGVIAQCVDFPNPGAASWGRSHEESL
jgi:hypothetical protein